MTAVWLLSTRGRPEACQQVLDACEATGMRSQGVVYVDGTPDEYRNLRLPKNWILHCERRWGGLQASMQWAFREFPDATQYGWLADDTLPRTDNWDTQLEAAAGDWCLSYARDLWLSELEGTRAPLEYGDDLSSGLCWGGRLVRTVGWWALPGVWQAAIDTAWCSIAGQLDLTRYTHEVTVEHLHHKNLKRPPDAVDENERLTYDLAVYAQWAGSAEYAATLKRITSSADVALTPLGVERLKERMRAQMVNAQWTPQMPETRMQKLLELINAGLDQTVADLLSAHPDVEPA